MKHFEVGQIVWLEKRRYQIIAYGSDSAVSLLPLDETGPIRVETPYFLSNTLRSRRS